MQIAWKLGVVALVALALVILPGGGALLDVVLTLLTITFFAAIAFLAYRLYRQYRFELETLPGRQRLSLYGSLGARAPDVHRHQPAVRRGRPRRARLVRAARPLLVRPLLGLDAVPQLRLSDGRCRRGRPLSSKASAISSYERRRASCSWVIVRTVTSSAPYSRATASSPSLTRPASR